MNNNVSNSIIYMEKEELNNLLTEVKETVANDMDTENDKDALFSAADLWKIQKQKRNATPRRVTFWN